MFITTTTNSDSRFCKQPSPTIRICRFSFFFVRFFPQLAISQNSANSSTHIHSSFSATQHIAMGDAVVMTMPLPDLLGWCQKQQQQLHKNGFQPTNEGGREISHNWLSARWKTTKPALVLCRPASIFRAKHINHTLEHIHTLECIIMCEVLCLCLDLHYYYLGVWCVGFQRHFQMAEKTCSFYIQTHRESRLCIVVFYFCQHVFARDASDWMIVLYNVCVCVFA